MFINPRQETFFVGNVKRLTRKKIQIRVIADEPEVVSRILKEIIERVELLREPQITGILPNRKEPGYRGYLLAEVKDNE
jgi:hypothetical protein